MTEPVLSIEKMNYKMGSRYLLRDINWTVNSGERWIVFGLNGSGKTTLLSDIAGYGRYSDGEIRVFGQAYTSENRRELRSRIGFVSSSFFDKYYRDETVKDIVASGFFGTLGVAGYCTREQDLRLRRILQQLRILSKADQSFSELSKGERQKVLIARALVGEPELLILDEAGTGLDVVAREELLQFIQTLAKRQLTIIHVTHYIEEILPEFQNTLLLRDGRIYYNGTTAEAFTDATMSGCLDRPVHIKLQDGRYTMQLQREEVL